MNLEQFKQILSAYGEYLESADYYTLDVTEKYNSHKANVAFISWLAGEIQEN